MGVVAVTFFSLDGLSLEMQLPEETLPDYFFRDIRSEGKTYPHRVYKRDYSRDFEYREQPPIRSTYKHIIHGMAADFYEKGDRTTKLTLHVSKKVFNKIHQEFAGKDAPETVTYLQFNTGSLPVFVRYAPEVEGPKLLLAEDLKNLTLKQLIDLKLSLDKERKT